MRPPKPVTRQQIREIDAVAIERYGIPGVVLMENAGRGAAQHTANLLKGAEGKKVTVVCGRGNNGGDGFVVARHLHNAGAEVRIVLAADAERLSGDAAINYRIVKAMGLPMQPVLSGEEVSQASRLLADADAVVDALLGTGFAGRVKPPLDALIERINTVRQRGCRVVAIDVPSGLDCDTGLPGGVAVRADLTVTFVAPKVGLLEPAAAEYVGELVVVDIGVPRELVPRQD